MGIEGCIEIGEAMTPPTDPNEWAKVESAGFANKWCDETHPSAIKNFRLEYEKSLLEAEARGKREIFESKEIRDFEKLALENHDRRCRDCDAHLSAYCDFIKASKAFTKLKKETGL